MRLFLYSLFLFVLLQCSPRVNPAAQQELFVVEVDERNYRISNRVKEEDSAVSAMISPYKSQLDETMGEVIGYLEEEIYKGRPNGTLNNWFADVLLEMAEKKYGGKVDFALQNYGGIRVPSLASGDLTLGKVYELMPFDNEITILQADGTVVQALMDRIADYGGWPVSHTVSIEVSKGQAHKVLIGGQMLNPTDTYTFALPDYVANGGDRADFLQGQKREDLGVLIRDAIIEYLRGYQGPLAIDKTQRIIINHE